ncbi:MAG: rhodanese-like domain-containing protein [Proteobacteria bacterium]|nr:MAG: rhodanese-like domain-containing protein [Pseudomonadota bacterium]
MDVQEMIIQCEELRGILASDPSSITLLDVRQPEEHLAAKIGGEVLIPLGDLSRRAQAELDPAKEVIVYCAHGVRSLHAVMGLKSMGFSRARSLNGGIAEYLGID